MSAVPAPDAATLKPGDKIRSTGDLRDGDQIVVPMVGTVRRRNSSWYVEGGKLGPTGLMLAVDRGEVRMQHPLTDDDSIPPPAPYTEPRDGDLIEIHQAPIQGRYRLENGRHWLQVEHAPNIGHVALNMALAEGRVRLVKAAAPRWQSGKNYHSPSTGRTFLYARSGCAGATAFWFDHASTDGVWLTDDEVPADLVPCDVVPTGEGA